jgi:hypothetical protein
MYYLLNLYEDDYNPKKLIIFLGEKSKKLLRYQRMIIAMRLRNSEKYGHEYIRNGTSSIFIAVEFKAMRG